MLAPWMGGVNAGRWGGLAGKGQTRSLRKTIRSAKKSALDQRLGGARLMCRIRTILLLLRKRYGLTHTEEERRACSQTSIMHHW
jgi:hypothetical protein